MPIPIYNQNTPVRDIIAVAPPSIWLRPGDSLTRTSWMRIYYGATFREDIVEHMRWSITPARMADEDWNTLSAGLGVLCYLAHGERPPRRKVRAKYIPDNEVSPLPLPG